MQKELSKYLKEKFNKVILKDIVDIFLFGSAVKGKEFPNDIDICVIFKQTISKKTLLELENIFQEFNAHISSLTVDNFFNKPHSLVKTILIEGVSLLSGKSFIENFGFFSNAFYSYDLSKLSSSEKVKFVYLIKGRKNEQGIVKKFGGEWMADSCFTIPIEKDSEILSILKKWAIPFKRKEVLVH